MRVLKIMLTLVLCGVGLLSLSCASESDSTMVSENQVVTVQRGDLTIDITASGNLALSVTEDLAFEMSGTVEEVLVEEGEIVQEGQVLVRLDISEWEDYLATLENQVVTKERDLLQAKINLKNAEMSLERAKDPISTTGREVSVVVIDPLDIEIKELQVELTKIRVEDAQKAVEDAQEALDEALDTSPEITAPFDGFIIKVNVEGGDEVLKGTVAVQLADPDKFEADVMVNEMDIFQVKLGGTAWVQVDAMSMIVLPAQVTHISPTATTQSGVVNYKVKVEIESLQAVLQEQREVRQGISSGELPERLQQAIEEGSITQEQAEEMIKQRQQGEGGQQGQMPNMIPEDFQLREGLTVTVSLLVEERNDVLLVPNAAIIRQGRETYVQVLSPDGTIENRAITTGISNWQYTEVAEGLSESEQVVVPQATTTPTTPQQQGPQGGIMIPGMGRPR